MSENFYVYDTEITVVRPWYAPLLSDIKIVKQKQIQMIKQCYIKFYNDEEIEERVEHLDNAFHRDSECLPFADGGVISGALRNIGYKNAIVRGIVYIPHNSILIETRSVTAKDKKTVWNTEYVVPGTVINAKLMINLPDLTTAQLYFGFKRSKGYGMTKAKFKRLT